MPFKFHAKSTLTLLLGVLSFSSLTGIKRAHAWEACPPTVQVQSSNSNTSTSITFVVDTGVRFPVDIMWIDQSGRMQKYNRLAPGQSYTQQTYVGHMWVAFDGSNCEYFEGQFNHFTATVYPE